MRSSLLALAGLVCSFSCGSDVAGPKRGLEIAVIPKGTTHEFWKSVHDGARKAGLELGAQVVWKGPVREDDREGQVRVVNDFVAKQVSGIVLAPLDAQALVPAVREAHEQGVPVAIIDSALAEGPQISFVATDNHEGGAIAARHLGRLLGGHGKVLVMRYQVGSASTEARERGFLETLRAEHPGIEVVSDSQYAGATTELAYQTAENLLVRFPRLDGVFVPNETTTIGMLRALQDEKRAGAVKLVGFDSNQKLLDALRSGELHGLVLQDPFRMGYLGVKTMVEHLRGVKVAVRVDTGVHLATRESLGSPQIQAVLAPELRGQ